MACFFSGALGPVTEKQDTTHTTHMPRRDQPNQHEAGQATGCHQPHQARADPGFPVGKKHPECKGRWDTRRWNSEEKVICARIGLLSVNFQQKNTLIFVENHINKKTSERFNKKNSPSALHTEITFQRVREFPIQIFPYALP